LMIGLCRLANHVATGELPEHVRFICHRGPPPLERREASQVPI
jgi:hypothetical protein